MPQRDELAVAVRARLARVVENADLSAVTEPGAVDEARQLTDLLRDGDGDVESRYFLGWLHGYRYNALPEDERDAELCPFTGCRLDAVIDGGLIF